MVNKPFTSQCTDVYKETTSNIVPNAFGLPNVTAIQTHDRTVYDTVSTRIVSNFQPQMQMPSNNYCCGFNNAQVMNAQPQLGPCGGVTFTFNPASVNSQQYRTLQNVGVRSPCLNPLEQVVPQQPYQQPLTLQQQIALKQMEQQGLELMLIQEQLKKNPYKLQFHHNGQTSTTDLLCGRSQVPPSCGMPDLKNALAALAGIKKDIDRLGIDKLPPNSPPNALYSEVYKEKRLILTKSPDIYKDKPKPSDTCALNKCQTEKETCADKEAATNSKRNSRDEKPKKLCKKPKKSKKKELKTKHKGRHSKSSESMITSDESEEYYDEDDFDDFDNDSYSEGSEH